MAGIINSFRFVQSTPNFVLDGLSATAGWGFRKMKDDYVGNICRVRRVADNVEQDFGFDGNGNFDIPGLILFLGTTGPNINEGRITIIYDQSGNGHNLIQPTTSKQWRIGENSLRVWAIASLGTSQGMYVDGITINAYTYSLVLQPDYPPSIIGVQGVISKRATSADSKQMFFTWSLAGFDLVWDQGSGSGANRFDTGVSHVQGQKYVYQFKRPLNGSGNREWYRSGVLAASTSTNLDVVNSERLTLLDEPSTAGRAFGGTFQEFILLNYSASSIQLTNMNTSQTDYYF